MKYRLGNTRISSASRERHHHSLKSAVLAICLLISSLSKATPMFMGLGDLPNGGFYARPVDISADGKTVVGTGYLPAGNEMAFRWTKEGMEWLGALPGGNGYSYASGVSADGKTVVGTSTSFNTTWDDISAEAFRWTESGGMQGIGRLSDGYISAATNVSADGATVFGNASLGAFRWTENSGMQELRSLGGQMVPGEIYDVSADGNNFVGIKYYGPSANRNGFLLTESGEPQILRFPGAWSTNANAVSANGATVVGDAWDGYRTWGFSWTSANGMKWLAGAAVDVSDDGNAIVGYTRSINGAYYWTEREGLRSFKDVLENDYGLDLIGWNLSFATAISADGLSVVGHGINPSGQSEAWLARLDPTSLALTPGTLPAGMGLTFEQAAGVKQPGNFQTFTQPGSFASGVFVDGVDRFDPSKQTYVLVHGWNGPDSYSTTKEKEVVHPWVVEMANGLRVRNPDANILAWNWTQSADSLAPDSKIQNIAPCLLASSLSECNIVPTNQVTFQANHLASTLEGLYSSFSGQVGSVQLLGHSLGGGIAATVTDLLMKHDADIPVKRLTLFDVPENQTASNIGGAVKLDALVLPDILKNSSAPTVENYLARGFTDPDLEPTAYGETYANVANTSLFGYVHFQDDSIDTPMDWYQKTVLAHGDAGNVGKRGLNELPTSMKSRYDENWGNQNAGDHYDLTKLGAIAQSYVTQYVLEKWTDLMQWGGEQVDKAVTGVQAVTVALKDKTVALWDTLKDKLQGEPGSLNTMRVGDSAVFVPASAGEWSAVGEAEIVAGLGLKQVTHSPSYAFTNIHIPDNADSFIVEFMPMIWVDDDTYFIAFDDQILYWLDGSFFKNDWMTTGFLDIALWAGKDVLLTIGLISDEAGHEVVTGGYGFFSQERLTSEQVPEPATLALLLLGIVLLAFGRARPMRGG